MFGPNSRVTAMVIIGLIIFFYMTGCASASTTLTKTLSIQEIDEKIRQTVELSNIKPSDEAKLKKLYDIDSRELDGFALYIASSNLKADELLILKAKGGADMAAIKAKVAKRVDKQLTTFKDYLPEEHFLVQKHVSRVNGSYVLFVVSKDAQKVAGAFDQVLR